MRTLREPGNGWRTLLRRLPVVLLLTATFGSGQAVVPADPAVPQTPPQRPFVKAELHDGTTVEGRLDYFDDGMYRLITREGLRTIAEDNLSDLQLVVPYLPRTGKPLDPQVALLIQRFTRTTKDPEGVPQGYDPRLIPQLVAQGEQVIEPLIAEVAKNSSIYQAVGRVFLHLGPKAHPVLVEAVRKDPGGAAARPVWWAFRECGVSCAPLMAELLGDDDPRIRKLAIDVLYSLGTTSGVALPPELDDVLIRAFDDQERSVREQAPLILGRIGFNSARALPALLATLDSPKHADIRLKSVSALGDMVRELKGDDPDLRMIVAALTAAAEKDSNESVRYYACYYLGQLGSRAAAALPALRRATDDKIELVRQSAEEAVQKVAAAGM